MDIIVLFILGYFLPFYPPNNPKIKISENWNKFQEISSFYTLHQKLWLGDVWFLKYGTRQMGTDGKSDM